MTPLLLRILTPTLTQLRMAHNPGILAVQEHVGQVLVGEVGVFQGGFDVVFGEAWIQCLLANTLYSVVYSGYDIIYC